MVARGNQDGPPVGKLEDADLLKLMRACEAEYLSRQGDGIGKRPSSVIATVDLALAAFYNFKGVPLVKIEPRGDRSRGGVHQDFRFFFAMTKEIANRLQTQWLNSDAFRYDASVRNLKKACSESRGRRR